MLLLRSLGVMVLSRQAERTEKGKQEEAPLFNGRS